MPMGYIKPHPEYGKKSSCESCGREIERDEYFLVIPLDKRWKERLNVCLNCVDDKIIAPRMEL